MYKLTLTPTGSVLKTLYRFDKTHGFDPTALVQGTDGNFYGTTLGGGTLSGGPSINGVIFKMNPAGQTGVGAQLYRHRRAKSLRSDHSRQ